MSSGSVSPSQFTSADSFSSSMREAKDESFDEDLTVLLLVDDSLLKVSLFVSSHSQH
jgi:hypothetical protein